MTGQIEYAMIKRPTFQPAIGINQYFKLQIDFHRSKIYYLLKKCKGDKTPKGEPTARRKSPLLLEVDILMFGTSYTKTIHLSCYRYITSIQPSNTAPLIQYLLSYEFITIKNKNMIGTSIKFTLENKEAPRMAILVVDLPT